MTETHNVPELDRAAAVLELQQAIERPLHTVYGALEKLQRSFPDPMREKARTLLQEGIAAGEDRRRWEVTVTAPDGHSTDLTLQDVAGTAGERVGSPMQRFFFDFSDSTRDCVGTELNDLELAEAQARCSLLLAASEDCSSDLSVTIRNEAGLPLSEVTLSLAVERAAH